MPRMKDNNSILKSTALVDAAIFRGEMYYEISSSCPFHQSLCLIFDSC